MLKTLCFKLGFAICTLLLTLMPTWIFLLVYHLAGPATFMERTAVMGLGMWFGGTFQIGLLVFWICLIVHLKDLK